MDATRKILIITVICALTIPSFADWFPNNTANPGNSTNHKMHFPQLPDPNGLDVNFEAPNILADDWLCTGTGPVEDIHFWVSHRENVIPLLFDIRIKIYSNIPAPAIGGFSTPGQVLWEGDLFPLGEDFDYASATGGVGEQGWYNPVTGEYNPNDHSSYHQVNLTNIKNPFIQQQGEIYWLSISFDTSNAEGWKTADLNAYPTPYTGQHYEDDAVYLDTAGAWEELRYPSHHPLAGQSIDLAFVITPEPVTLTLLLIGGGLVLLRRRS